MKFLEQAAARQALQNPESKGGAPDAAAGDAERRAFLLIPWIAPHNPFRRVFDSLELGYSDGSSP